MKQNERADHGQFEVKVVGKSGQISLGKSYAGKTFRLERRKDGTRPLTSVALIPEHQLCDLAGAGSLPDLHGPWSGPRQQSRRKPP